MPQEFFVYIFGVKVPELSRLLKYQIVLKTSDGRHFIHIFYVIPIKISFFFLKNKPVYIYWKVNLTEKKKSYLTQRLQLICLTLSQIGKK